MLDIVRFADHVEAHLTRPSRVAVTRLLGKLNAIVGQYRADAVRHGFQQIFQKLPRCSSIGFVDEPGDSELAGAMPTKQLELALGSLHFTNINVEATDRIALEVLTLWLVAFDVW